MGHISTETLARAAGIELVHVPCRAYPAAMGSDLTVFGGPLRGGRLRALAAIPAERSRFPPDVPALPELPAVDGSVWIGLLAPAATPDEIVTRLGGELRAWLATEEAVAGLANISQEPAPLDGAAPGALVREETTRFAGIRPD